MGSGAEEVRPEPDHRRFEILPNLLEMAGQPLNVSREHACRCRTLVTGLEHK